jgi:ribosomal protein L1
MMASRFSLSLAAIKEAQPSGIKGLYILNVTIAPTMGPSVKVSL